MNYNHLLNSHFSSCPLIAEIKDEGHGRVIKAHYIDSLTEVGLHDGVDSWVASAATAFRTPDLSQTIKTFLEGGSQPYTPPVGKIERRRVHVD